MPENRYACPQCLKRTALWQGVDVPGWQGLDEELKPQSGHSEREVDWANAQPDGTVGCGECGWEGRKSNLIVYGWDDQPLIKPSSAQLSLEA